MRKVCGTENKKIYNKYNNNPQNSGQYVPLQGKHVHFACTNNVVGSAHNFRAEDEQLWGLLTTKTIAILLDFLRDMDTTKR